MSLRSRAGREGRGDVVLLLRPSRQVDRVWAPVDALLYNMMTMNVVMGFGVPLLTAVLVSSRFGWALATVVAAVFCAAEAVVYAFLASSMPRSGGEYYFQARLISTGVGSVFCFTAIVLGGTLWVAVEGWLAARFAVGPLLVAAGCAFQSQSTIAAGAWTQSAWGVFVLSLVVIVWSAVANAIGMRRYAILQRQSWLVAGVALAVVIVGLLAAGDLGSLPVYKIGVERASHLGFTPTITSLLKGTLLVVPLASFMLVYGGWSTQQAGETKRASELRVELFAILGAVLATALMSGLVGQLVLDKFGARTLAAASYLFFDHPEQMPLPTVPFLWFVASPSMAAKAMGLVVALLFNALFWMYAPNPTLAASRVLLAMSSDHILPRWVGNLRLKTKAPIDAIALFSILCVVPCALYAFSGYWRLMLSTTTLTNIIAFAVTCAAGATFPFARRELYRESAASRYEVLGVPVITIAGCAFVIFAAFMVWRFVGDPLLSLGVSYEPAVLISLSTYGFSIALYFVSRRYRHVRESAELQVWYTELPSTLRSS